MIEPAFPLSIGQLGHPSSPWPSAGSVFLKMSIKPYQTWWLQSAVLTIDQLVDLLSPLMWSSTWYTNNPNTWSHQELQVLASINWQNQVVLFSSSFQNGRVLRGSHSVHQSVCSIPGRCAALGSDFTPTLEHVKGECQHCMMSNY